MGRLPSRPFLCRFPVLQHFTNTHLTNRTLQDGNLAYRIVHLTPNDICERTNLVADLFLHIASLKTFYLYILLTYNILYKVHILAVTPINFLFRSMQYLALFSLL